jgi:RNA ligase
MINNFTDLRRHVVSGETNWSQYGCIKAVEQDGLILFNYTGEAQLKSPSQWNWFETVSRGLILDRKTGATVALPFKKFHNWYEGATNASLVEATQKMDGSLGILYRHDRQFKVATRGSFNSDQALWATEYLKRYNLSLLPNHMTLLFEIIYPENRVVVNYGDREDLVLIGVRSIATGADYNYRAVKTVANQLMFNTPEFTQLASPRDYMEMAAKLSADEEGWVLRFSDGSRWKIKGEAYRLAHQMMTGVSFKTVLEATAAGIYNEMIAGVPDEFLGKVREWKLVIDDRVDTVCERVAREFEAAPKGSRKEFAQYVMASCPDDKAYMFRLLDNRGFIDLIYKHEFQEEPVGTTNQAV